MNEQFELITVTISLAATAMNENNCRTAGTKRRSQVTGQVTGHRSQGTGHRAQVTGHRLSLVSRSPEKELLKFQYNV